MRCFNGSRPIRGCALLATLAVRGSRTRRPANGAVPAATPKTPVLAARPDQRYNVKNLKIAWVWRGDNFGSQPEYKSETTPLMVDGVLYFTAGDRRSVVAANPGTGETLWVWRLDEGARADGVRKNSRGVAYWADGQQRRIFTVTPGYQLVALDAKNGDTD
jgi:outer membrane protein assembly factor BamB